MPSLSFPLLFLMITEAYKEKKTVQLRAEAECAFMQPDAKCILEIAVSRAQGTKNLPATQGSVIIMPSCPLIG